MGTVRESKIFTKKRRYQSVDFTKNVLYVEFRIVPHCAYALRNCKFWPILSLLVTLINTKLQAALAGQYEMHFKLLKK